MSQNFQKSLSPKTLNFFGLFELFLFFLNILSAFKLFWIFFNFLKKSLLNYFRPKNTLVAAGSCKTWFYLFLTKEFTARIKQYLQRLEASRKLLLTNSKTFILSSVNARLKGRSAEAKQIFHQSYQGNKLCHAPF